MRTKITYGELIKRLVDLGFVEKRLKGSHTILFNEEYNSTIVLPSYRKSKIAELYLILSIKKNIIGKGILNQEEFQNFIENMKQQPTKRIQQPTGSSNPKQAEE